MKRRMNPMTNDVAQLGKSMRMQFNSSIFAGLLLAILLSTDVVGTVDSEEVSPSLVREAVLEWLPKRRRDPGDIDPATRYGEAVLPVVKEVLAKPSQLSPHEAERALLLVQIVNKSDPSIVPLLGPYLQAEHWQTRVTAVEALGVVGDRRDAPVLLVMMSDEHPSVRRKAIEAVKRVGAHSRN